MCVTGEHDPKQSLSRVVRLDSFTANGFSMHLPSQTTIDTWPEYTPEHPIRILVSACLVGVKCGVNGTSYGEFPWITDLSALPNVKTVTFCPEDFAFGTPRNTPDIHGGTGFDVLDGKAKVFSDIGEDWTAGMIQAAWEMLKIAQCQSVDLAILQDMSAACGTQVISDGCRLIEKRKYQKGPGVCSALLIRNGIAVVSQRDFRTLGLVAKKLDPHAKIDASAIDHHESDWYIKYFAPIDQGL
jgi:uncharacterized protein YbbK (DUF523 family)